MASKIDHIIRKSDGITEKTLNDLLTLSNAKSIASLYEAVRIIKYNILRDEFSFPEGDEKRNAQNKAFCKGGDFYLTLLMSLIKRSGEMLDKLEESKEKKREKEE